MSVRRPIRFIRGESECENVSNANEDDKSGTTGEEAMRFYQELISTRTSDEGNGIRSLCDEMRPQRTSKRSKQRKRPKIRSNDVISGMTSEEAEQALMFGSQNGDVEAVKRAVASGSCEVNCRDCFDWTALMCACTAGHYHIVKILLEWGATWRDNFDKCGRNALDLARMGRFNDVETLLLTSDHNVDHKRARKRVKTTSMPYWCSECDMNVIDGVGHEHKKSTVHQFSRRQQSGATQSPHYILGHNNVGYQMMVRDGWTEEKGLGRDSQGRWYPIKTVLKKNRSGLGTAGESARVTHFGPFDATAVRGRGVSVEVATRQATKNERIRSCERERQMEISFRRSFNSADG